MGQLFWHGEMDAYSSSNKAECGGAAVGAGAFVCRTCNSKISIVQLA
jgi:hypothetical protein